jgi:hypothetical protein
VFEESDGGGKRNKRSMERLRRQTRIRTGMVILKQRKLVDLQNMKFM